jgi:hypothetical protein
MVGDVANSQRKSLRQPIVILRLLESKLTFQTFRFELATVRQGSYQCPFIVFVDTRSSGIVILWATEQLTLGYYGIIVISYQRLVECYIAIVEHNGTGGSLALILGIVLFFIPDIASLLFAIMPSGRTGMFGDRVAGKSREYLASQTFTATPL